MMKHEPASTHFHAVRFYENPEALFAVVSEFIGEAIEAGQPAVVIARPSHCAGILDGLRRRGFDPEQLCTTGDLSVFDAGRTLATFMVNGQPNAALFEAQAAR